MNILFAILMVISAFIGLLLVVGIFMSKQHYVRRDVVIDAPVSEVFGYLKLLKNQDKFNEGAMSGADRKREFKGTDGTVGYIYAWSGDKDAGVGEKEIIEIVDGKKIESEIRFVKPMKVSARVIFETESLTGTKTRVYWSNAGKLNYPLNVMIPMMQKSVAKSMERSLVTLKKNLEERT